MKQYNLMEPVCPSALWLSYKIYSCKALGTIIAWKYLVHLWFFHMWQGCCTGTLDGLVDSHTRLAIYPTLTICCQRVVVHALLNTGFKGIQVVTYPANVKQLKSHWLKVPQKGLGTCIWINETHSSFWLCSAPQRGTEIAGVEGLWLVSRPKHSVSEDSDDSSEVLVCSPFIVPSQSSMRDPCDVIWWCHNCLLWPSGRKTTVHVHWKHLQFICTSTGIHTRIPDYYKCIQTSLSFP